MITTGAIAVNKAIMEDYTLQVLNASVNTIEDDGISVIHMKGTIASVCKM